LHRARGLSRGTPRLTGSWRADAGFITIYLARAEGVFRPEEVAERGREALVAGFRGDPGPCVVAVAALHVSEERASGEARVRSPGLHLRMAVLGATQIRDLPVEDHYNVVYSVGWAPEDALDGLKPLLGGLPARMAFQELTCSREELLEAFKRPVTYRVSRL